MHNQRRRFFGYVLMALLVALFVAALVSTTPTALASTAQEKLVIRYFDLEVEDRDSLPANVDPDVTSGDVILITTPDGQHIMIDSTVPHLGTALVTRLRELGVEKLHYAFATHPHVDHIGGYQTLLDHIPVDVFYQINLPYETSGNYHRLQNAIARNNVTMEYVECGDVFQIGEVRLEALNPPRGTSRETVPGDMQMPTAFVNDLSLVLRLDYKDFSMLFTGDIYMAREMELLDAFPADKLKVDILDVPHHGCVSSSSTIFLMTVDPKYAIISMDGICSTPVYNKYLQRGIEVFITGYNGEITIVTDGDEIEITTEKELRN